MLYVKKQRLQTLFAALTGLGSVTITGCAGGNNAVVVHQTYVYSARGSFYGQGTIEQIKMGDDGSVTPMSPPSVTIPFDMAFIAADPLGRFVYTANYKNAGVIGQFVVKSDGTLQANSVPSINFGNQPGPITFSPDGNYAIICSAGNASMSVFRINTDGTLTLVSSAASGVRPLAPTVTHSGRYVYVTDQISGNIYEYTLSSGGQLQSAGSIYSGQNPVSLAITPNGFFLLCINANSSTVTCFAINAGTGALTLVGTTDVPPHGTNPTAIIIDSTGQYAFVENYLSTITRYKIDLAGHLIQNGVDIDVGPGLGVSHLSIDSSRRNVFLFADTQGDYVYHFGVTNDGSLDRLGRYNFPTFDISDAMTTVRH